MRARTGFFGDRATPARSALRLLALIGTAFAAYLLFSALDGAAQARSATPRPAVESVPGAGPPSAARGLAVAPTDRLPDHRATSLSGPLTSAMRTAPGRTVDTATETATPTTRVAETATRPAPTTRHPAGTTTAGTAARQPARAPGKAGTARQPSGTRGDANRPVRTTNRAPVTVARLPSAVSPRPARPARSSQPARSQPARSQPARSQSARPSQSAPLTRPAEPLTVVTAGTTGLEALSGVVVTGVGELRPVVTSVLDGGRPVRTVVTGTAATLLPVVAPVVAVLDPVGAPVVAVLDPVGAPLRTIAGTVTSVVVPVAESLPRAGGTVQRIAGLPTELARASEPPTPFDAVPGGVPPGDILALDDGAPYPVSAMTGPAAPVPPGAGAAVTGEDLPVCRAGNTGARAAGRRAPAGESDEPTGRPRSSPASGGGSPGGAPGGGSAGGHGHAVTGQPIWQPMLAVGWVARDSDRNAESRTLGTSPLPG